MLRRMQGVREPLIHFQIRNISFRQWSFGGLLKNYCGPQIYLFIYDVLHEASINNSGLYMWLKCIWKEPNIFWLEAVWQRYPGGTDENRADF
jgi:hypothetical protein